MRTAITFEVDTDNLGSVSEEYLCQLWHIGQANPAPLGDVDACNFADHVGREIVRRWVACTPASLWTHQAAHIAARQQVGRA